MIKSIYTVVLKYDHSINMSESDSKSSNNRTEQRILESKFLNFQNPEIECAYQNEYTNVRRFSQKVILYGFAAM